MKPPPLLLGAALLFWGWQSEFLVVGACLAALVEGARLVKERWEFSNDDLARIWTFCSVLLLAALLYAFTENEGPASFSNLFQNPSVTTQTGAGASSARTASALFRWMPMLFFPFIAALAFSTRTAVPLTVFSYILQRRLKRAKAQGRLLPPVREVSVDYPYFAVCLVAASVHRSEGTSFFWGVCGLLAWALWLQRSRRFGVLTWGGALVAAVALGYYGQYGAAQVQRYLSGLSPSWIVRLRYGRSASDPAQTRTVIGRVGELKLSPRIIIRLETPEGAPPPEYLREASYRVYRSQVWYAGSSRDDFASVPETPPNSASFPLLPGKTNTARVRIACYLEGRRKEDRAGLLPLPGGSGRLEQLPAFTVEKNSAGAVLATGFGLVQFWAHYGPGATIDSPPGTGSTNTLRPPPPSDEHPPHPRGPHDGFGEPRGRGFRRAITGSEDLDVSSREEEALETIVQQLNLRGRTLEEAQGMLRNFFAEQFAYSTWQRAERVLDASETPLSRFLLQTRKGHCEYFATATVLLLRQAGFSARYAVGYAVHEPAGKKYVVRERDAHAWALVWDEARKTWVDFDTTPASWIAEEAQRASRWQWLSDGWAWMRYQAARVWWGQTRLRQYVLWGLIPVLALLLYQILRRRRRRRDGVAAAGETTAWPGLDSEFYRLERRLAARGVPREPSEPLAHWLERAARAAGTDALRGALRDLLRLHYRYRFDPAGLTATEREALRKAAQSCLQALAQAGPADGPR